MNGAAPCRHRATEGIRAGAEPRCRQAAAYRVPNRGAIGVTRGVEAGWSWWQESVRRESDGLLDERQRLGRRLEAGGPREQHRKIEQDAEGGIPAIADLKRLDTARETTGASGGECHGFQVGAGENFQPQQDQKDTCNHVSPQFICTY